MRIGSARYLSSELTAVHRPKQIEIGTHPCPAAPLPILDKASNWDFTDEFYNRRRAAITVAPLACKAFDDGCFCTSVGLGPVSEKGSDALLYETADGPLPF